MFRSYRMVFVTAVASVFVAQAGVFAQAVPTLVAGSVVSRRTAAGEVLLDTVLSRNGAEMDIMRTRLDARGNVVSRERHLRRKTSAGIVDRTTSSELLIRPTTAYRTGDKFTCGYSATTPLDCTALDLEMITTPMGRFAARRVLMATRSSNAAYVELWLDDDLGVIRARGRSDNADADYELADIRVPDVSRPAMAPTIASMDINKRVYAGEPEQAVAHPASTRGVIVQFGGGFAKRKTLIPTFSLNGHDTGVSASVSVGGFLSSHIAMTLSADAFRQQAAGDIVDGAYTVYPKPRHDQLMVAGPALLFTTGRRSGLFLRVGGGIVLAEALNYSVTNRRVIATWNYRGTSVGYNGAIGAMVPIGSHFAITPYISAIAVPSIDVHQLGTNALYLPGARQTVIGAGMSLGTR